MNAIRAILNSHAAAGYRQITAHEKDLYDLYLAVRETIEARIEAYVLASRSSLTGPRLVALSKELQELFAAFEKRYRKTLKHATEGIAESFYRAAIEDMQLGDPEVAGSINSSTLKQMVEDDFAHVAGATRKMTQTAVGSLRRISARVMREAAMTGETRRAVSKRLYQASGGPSFLFRDAGGHVWNSKAYFRMLGRTVLHNNARETYLNACADNGSDIVAVSHSGDACDTCASWEGRLLSITGQSPYPTVETATADGLFHPNCTHRLVAVPPSVAQARFDERGRPRQDAPGQRRSKDKQSNTVPEPGNERPGFAPEEGFTRSPAATQFVGKTRNEVYAELDKTKDHERFVAYDSSGRLLDVYESGPSGGSVPAHMRIPGITLVHNHPGGWRTAERAITEYGASFSRADVITTVGFDWQGIEAVTPRRVYSLTRPDGGWNVSRQALQDQITSAEAEVRRIIAPRVVEGRISMEVANSLHHDMLWKRVARTFGFRYTKETRHVDR